MKLCESAKLFGIWLISANKNIDHLSQGIVKRGDFMKKVKQYEVLEEGCLKLTLSSKKEFDSYMLEVLNRYSQALPCRMKQRSSITFFYDIGEQLSLPVLLRLNEFEERDAYTFLSQLFDSIIACEKELPLFASIDCIFYELDKEAFSFVILPIHDHSYDNDWVAFLKELLKAMRFPKDSLYGCLCALCMKEGLTPLGIADQLRQWKSDHRLLTRLRMAWIRWREQKERMQSNDRNLQEERQRIRFAQRANQMESTEIHSSAAANDTVVLFPAAGKGCLKDELGHCFSLREETRIGRSEQCDIVLAHPTVSLHHACIKKDQSGCYIIDQGSSNGTRLNGKKLKQGKSVHLHDQDVILFADVAMVYAEQGA